MKKKVLFLSPLPPPDYGSAISSKMCLEIFRQSGRFEVHNIKLNYSKSSWDVGKINFDKMIGFLRVRNQIKKELREFNPDMIYFVPATGDKGFLRDYIFSKIINKNYRGKILFHIRGRINKSDLKKHSKRYINMFQGNSAIVLGNELINDIPAYLGCKSVYILPNAIGNFISDSEFKKIINQRKKRKEANILFLSNMDRSKGWPKLLEACKILNEKNLEFKCDFAGEWVDEKDRKIFYDFLNRNALGSKISYLGKRTGGEKEFILRNSDILVFPTEYRFETFGRVVIEAMAAGLPVIANSIAAIPSIIDDRKTGFLLKENSPSEIAKYLGILIKNNAMRIKLGKEGRKKFLKEYNLGKYERNFLRIINSF